MIEQPPGPLTKDATAVHDEPVQETDRLQCLDFIRGIAILCILPINIFAFAMPGQAYMWPYVWGAQSPLDIAVFSLVYALVMLKFVSIFSILFGAGLWLQTEKTARKGMKPEGHYLRRLLFLGMVGLAHGLFFWWGDILLPYAIAGVVVLYLRNIPMNAMKWTAILLLAVPALCCFTGGAGIMGLTATTGTSHWPEKLVESRPPATFEAAPDVANNSFTENLGNFSTATMNGDPAAFAITSHYYANGNAVEILAIRAMEWMSALCGQIFMFGIVILGYNFLGVWLMRRGAFADIEGHRPFWLKAMFWGFLIGVPVHALGVWSIYAEQSTLGMIIHSLITPAGALALTLGYLASLVLVSRTTIAKQLGGPLRACGRMAFTCYLAQTLVMTTIFYGYGFGLYGRFGYATLELFTLGMWIVLLVFCHLWLKRYRMGPLEWLWRSFTYGEWQPNRRVV